MAKTLAPWLLVALLVGLVGCDHVTKRAAHTALSSGRVVTVIPNVLDLTYAENRGSAFSVVDGSEGAVTMRFLVAVSLCAIGAIGVFWYRTRRGSVVAQAGCACLLAGAIGNFVDRALRGYVVDFVHLHHWPVFNVADVAIGVGIGLLALASFPKPREPHAG